MHVRIEAAAASHIGKMRTNNEDNLFFNGYFIPLNTVDAGVRIKDTYQDAVQIYAVCDGIGGGEAGERASFQATSAMATLRDGIAGGAPVKESIGAYLQGISQEIAKSNKGKLGGSTVVMLCIQKSHATIAHLGDSRLYFLRRGELQRLTQDHTAGQRLVNLGVISREQAEVDPGNNVLVRYLGERDPSEPPPYEEITVRPKDVFLLCSDGLTNMVDESEIRTALLSASAPEEACEHLLIRALDAGGKDNITILVINVNSTGIRIWEQ